MKVSLSISALLILSYSCNNVAPKTENTRPIDSSLSTPIDTLIQIKDTLTQSAIPAPPPTIQQFVAPKIDRTIDNIDDIPPPISTEMYQTADAGSNPYYGEVEAAAIGPEDQIYDNPEVRPEFKPDNQLTQFLKDNLTYPDDALEMGIIGVTHVSFVVEKDGSITNVKILKSSGHQQLDNEAKRVIKKMPPWSPGKMNGQAVRCRAKLPIQFEITE